MGAVSGARWGMDAKIVCLRKACGGCAGPAARLQRAGMDRRLPLPRAALAALVCPGLTCSAPSVRKIPSAALGKSPNRRWWPGSVAAAAACNVVPLPHAFSVQEWIVAFRYPGRHSLRSFALGWPAAHLQCGRFRPRRWGSRRDVLAVKRRRRDSARVDECKRTYTLPPNPETAAKPARIRRFA
jgi:hypothetical protein